MGHDGDFRCRVEKRTRFESMSQCPAFLANSQDFRFLSGVRISIIAMIIVLNVIDNDFSSFVCSPVKATIIQCAALRPNVARPRGPECRCIGGTFAAGNWFPSSSQE